MSKNTFLRLTKTDKKDPRSGCFICKLGRYEKGGNWQLIEEVECITGVSSAQNFRTGKDPKTFPGNLEPIPEGYYWLDKPAWKGLKPKTWDIKWSNSLGPVWIGLNKLNASQTPRGAFGIHLDGGAVGTAGCIGIADQETMLTVLRWWNELGSAPKFITVNWGHKTVDTGNGSMSRLPISKEEPKKKEAILKKVDSTEGVDKGPLIKLPWPLSMFKGTVKKLALAGVSALIGMLAGQLPFLAPWVDKIIIWITPLVDILFGG